MSSCELASAVESESHSPLLGHAVAEPGTRERQCKRARAIPDLPKDYPQPGRFGGKELWDAVLSRRIPRSTFVDWQKSGRIPPADKVIGRTRFWLELRVHATMTAGKAVA
jgi:hypothetical protein